MFFCTHNVAFRDFCEEDRNLNEVDRNLYKVDIFFHC